MRQVKFGQGEPLKKWLLLPLFFFIPLVQGGVQEDIAAAEKDIVELERKVAEIKKDIVAVKEKTADDARQFKAYEALHDKTIQSLRAERDSLKKDYRVLQDSADVYTVKAQRMKRSQDFLSANQKRFRTALVSACDEVLSFLDTVPPSNVIKQRDATQFLKSELVTDAIGTIEGLERLWQIFSALQAQAESIDLYSGESPDAALSGSVEYLRLGYVWLACLTNDGEAGLVWYRDTVAGEEQRSGRWKVLEKELYRTSLHTAIDIRKGKTVPKIAFIPVQQDVFVTMSQKDGEE